jgi:phosphoribosylglycinamide formyltransferase 1
VSVRIAVFASGGGSNFQALLDSFTGAAYAEVALLISDRAAAGALERARGAGVPALHVPMRDRAAGDIETDLTAALRAHRIDFIALAGYLRLVPVALTAAYRGRLVNIHPALLPAFGGHGMYGRRVHEAVLAAGCRVSGATVHWVDERYDEGGIIGQWPVPVMPGDTPESLAARVVRIEHRLYPAVVDALVRRLAGIASAPAAAAGADVFRVTISIEGLEAEITAVAGL